MIQRLQLFCLVLALCASMNLSCVSLAWCDEFAAGESVGVLESDLLREVSGIVASRRNSGVLWVHNDSGDVPQLYAIDTHGKLLGACVVPGAQARDWEDIAAGPGPEAGKHYLYIGDIGDNRACYASVRVYRVIEPQVDASATFATMETEPAETIELVYPDGPRDAETLLLDPQTRDLYIISKRDVFANHVYRASYPQSTTSTTTLTRVATLPWGFAVAGDVSPDGREIIVRSPYNASLWVRPVGAPLWEAFQEKAVGIPLRSEPQGEGICFDAQGAGVLHDQRDAEPAALLLRPPPAIGHDRRCHPNSPSPTSDSLVVVAISWAQTIWICTTLSYILCGARHQPI